MSGRILHEILAFPNVPVHLKFLSWVSSTDGTFSFHFLLKHTVITLLVLEMKYLKWNSEQSKVHISSISRIMIHASTSSLPVPVGNNDNDWYGGGSRLNIAACSKLSPCAALLSF